MISNGWQRCALAAAVALCFLAVWNMESLRQAMPVQFSAHQEFQQVDSSKVEAYKGTSKVEAVTPGARGPVPHPDLTKIAIIGGAGNVGSFLTLDLRSSFSATAFDMRPRIKGFQAVELHSNGFTKEQLQEFGTVIFLGGCTGRRACASLTDRERTQVMVDDVVQVIRQLNREQHFITASTSAVSEGRRSAKESDDVFETLLDEYSLAMFQREKALRSLALELGEAGPLITMLRFGTVVGVSPGQRTDLLVPSLFRSAYTRGVLTVRGQNVMRSWLALPDLARAIETLVRFRRQATGSMRFKIWNLASFHAKILKMATTVASITGSKLDVQTPVREIEANEPFTGFSLDTTSFTETFNFTFEEDLHKTLLDFDSKVPDSVTPKGPHMKELSVDSIPCPVCGSKDLQLVVDLGDQPFANDFSSNVTRALQSPRFPLKLVRCRVCNHYHLSHVASRSDLFEHYLYQSGTSATLKQHFDWLARKVQQESGKQEGSILELACNDGTQLDSFKALGWKTYGVDPAKNIGVLAQAKNHTVRIGFWPLEFPELPKGDDLTAITAQNVLAHVPFPVDFLKACAAVMGPNTKLYIQTSQCNMQQLGQFDTMYHEHISFFTGHSFYKAATLAGLVIERFETVPIHGESCLVTMQLGDSNLTRVTGASKNAVFLSRHVGCLHLLVPRGQLRDKPMAATLAQRLELERTDGVADSDFFAVKYMARAGAIREYVAREVEAWSSKGYVVGAYGAAAKGMTLLHFMLAGEKKQRDGHMEFLDFVLDDAPLKQNTFCPGTKIPVFLTEGIFNMPRNLPMAIVILAWNFFDEIALKLKAVTESHPEWKQDVVAILPFPEPRVVRITPSGQEVLRDFPNRATPIPNPLRDPSRKRTAMVTHFRDEEMMLPFFIIQHAPLFDEVIGIDFESTDKSVEIWNDFAPPGWQLVPSNQGSAFDAEKLDLQVMEVERRFPHHWVIALTSTEFLVYPYMKLDLFRKQHDLPGPTILESPAVQMLGEDRLPLLHYASLVKQRHVFGPAVEMPACNSCRAMHLETLSSHRYTLGRKRYAPTNGAETAKRKVNQEAYISKFQWTPWPESMRAVNVKAPEGSKMLEVRRSTLRDTAAIELCNDADSLMDEASRLVRRAFYAEVGGACILARHGSYHVQH